MRMAKSSFPSSEKRIYQLIARALQISQAPSKTVNQIAFELAESKNFCLVEFLKDVYTAPPFLGDSAEERNAWNTVNWDKKSKVDKR